MWSQQVAVGDLDMFGQRFNLAGGLVGTSFLVDSGGTVSSQSDAIGLPTGGFALAYLDNNFGELDITLSTWDATRQSVGLRHGQRPRRVRRRRRR